MSDCTEIEKVFSQWLERQPEKGRVLFVRCFVLPPTVSARLW